LERLPPVGRERSIGRLTKRYKKVREGSVAPDHVLATQGLELHPRRIESLVDNQLHSVRWTCIGGDGEEKGGTGMAGESLTTVTLEEAQSIIQAAQQKAQEIGQPMNIAVVDNGRELKAFARMEDAWLGSIEISIDKAFTAASFPDFSTQDLADVTQPGQPLYGLETIRHGRFVNFAGGIPLTRNGGVAGAIGVSGGTVDQDQEVAEAGLGAFS
jgi:uncharacterized protein GlcG (DUF336 family)